METPLKKTNRHPYIIDYDIPRMHALKEEVLAFGVYFTMLGIHIQ